MALSRKSEYAIAIGVISCFFFGPLIYASTFPPSIGASYSDSAPQAAAPESPLLTNEQAIASYKSTMAAIPSMAVFVSDIRPGQIDGLVEIQVTVAFQEESKPARESFAISLWEAWASVSGLEDVDKARIKLVDRQGEQVGGSKILGGSLIYVDD